MLTRNHVSLAKRHEEIYSLSMGEQFLAEDGAFILLEALYRARGKPARLLFSLRDSKTLIKNKKGTASPFITNQRNRTQHRVKRVAGRERSGSRSLDRFDPSATKNKCKDRHDGSARLEGVYMLHAGNDMKGGRHRIAGSSSGLAMMSKEAITGKLVG